MAPQKRGEGRGHPGKGQGAAGLRQAFPAQLGGTRAGSAMDSGEGGPTGRGWGAARPATHAGHFPLDVLEEPLLAAQEARVLELGVITLWLD